MQKKVIYRVLNYLYSLQYRELNKINHIWKRKHLNKQKKNSHILDSEEVFILELTENNLNINIIIF